jgi:hypothetical protein
VCPATKTKGSQRTEKWTLLSLTAPKSHFHVRMMKMKRRQYIILLPLLTGCLAGCSTPQGYYEVSVANRSSQDIIFVTINTDNPHGGSCFGFLGAGPRPGGKTASGTHLYLSPQFQIEWEESDVAQSCSLDLSGFRQSRNRIRRFEFVYQGHNKWSAVAKDNTQDSGQVVEPK